MRNLLGDNLGWRRAGALLAAAGLCVGLLGLPAQAQESAPQKTKQSRPRKPVNLRDPFRSLLVSPEDMIKQALPPGKRGLVISQLTVDGIVVTPTARVAVVNMRGRNRAFFLRVRDELFDGYVAEILEDGVVFRERASDAFGRKYERRVVKPLTTEATGTTR
ncbi:MAG: hypothetical protein ACE10O_02815 [Candidatus Acidiferrales bacterium]